MVSLINCNRTRRHLVLAIGAVAAWAATSHSASAQVPVSRLHVTSVIVGVSSRQHLDEVAPAAVSGAESWIDDSRLRVPVKSAGDSN